ncbi:MAG: polyketide synthase [Pirellulales bacterium]
MDSNSMELDGIAIIGISGRFPGAKNVEQFWQNLMQGKDCISRLQAEQLEFTVLGTQAGRTSRRTVAARGILEDVEQFDAEFFGIYPKEAEIMDPQHRIFLECAWESLEVAGYNPFEYSGMIGVFASSSLNTYLLHNPFSDGKFAGKLAGNYQVGEYQAMLGNDKDFMPTRVSYKLNLKGPSMAIQTACSSSLVAISQACNSPLSYGCDSALAGGVSITFFSAARLFLRRRGLSFVGWDMSNLMPQPTVRCLPRLRSAAAKATLRCSCRWRYRSCRDWRNSYQ